jgi:hypothetical protein
MGVRPNFALFDGRIDVGIPGARLRAEKGRLHLSRPSPSRGMDPTMSH